jgi:hypothetical protein
MQRAFCFLLTIVLLGSFRNVRAQVNLVPNPRFEDTTHCPLQLDEVEAATFWSSYGNSPDYYNGCSPINGVNMPDTPVGYQQSHSGSGMLGLILYIDSSNSANGANYREIAGCQLTSTLVIGQRYFMSFYVNYSGFNQYQAVACNNIGLRLSSVPFDSCCPPGLNNFAHLFSQSVLIDSVGWTKVSGSFVADSAYNYLMVGNFFMDSATDTLVLGSIPESAFAAYYFIDDICVTIDSLYNANWAGLPEVIGPTHEFTVFPNPTITGWVNIKCGEDIEQIWILNCLGQEVEKVSNVQGKEFHLYVGDLSAAAYSLTVKTTSYLHATSLIITR